MNCFDSDVTNACEEEKNAELKSTPRNRCGAFAAVNCFDSDVTNACEEEKNVELKSTPRSRCGAFAACEAEKYRLPPK
ncbi:MAG: hypothetical protein IK990_06860 [Ruminiclostridium sp.]|nr:hypothetical protein [Ruminiclostridium sp.]